MQSPLLMPPTDYRIVITKPARRDFRDILSYTNKNWGEAQRLEYKRKIDSALQSIAKKPGSGRKKLGSRVWEVGRHLIFYRIEAKHIFIVRILHQRMDATRHLDDLN